MTNELKKHWLFKSHQFAPRHVFSNISPAQFTFLSETGQCYLVSQDLALSWSDVEQECKAHGASFITLQTEDKYAVIKSWYIASTYAPGTITHLAITVKTGCTISFEFFDCVIPVMQICLIEIWMEIWIIFVAKGSSLIACYVGPLLGFLMALLNQSTSGDAFIRQWVGSSLVWLGLIQYKDADLPG